MKLILLRHAKSSWDDFSLDDHDRPLNARGRGSAEAIGTWLKDNAHLPDTAACSTAIRARETCELVCQSAGVTPKTRFVDGLYHASPDRVLREIQKSEPGTVLLVGHNPGFADLAAMLVAQAPMHKDFHRYPTAATLVLEFAADLWRDVKPGSGNVLDFVTPRELT